MGQRGPYPGSGVEFRGRPVVLQGQTPAILTRPYEASRVLADRRGYVAIHRLIASETLGRWVTRHEAVRHRDGNCWNWHPSNLLVEPLAASLPPGK